MLPLTAGFARLGVIFAIFGLLSLEFSFRVMPFCPSMIFFFSFVGLALTLLAFTVGI